MEFARCPLVLVRLTKTQIAEAEKVNGDRKTFTHAVLCGPYGQLFGTETFCRKYFNAWKKIFPLLFDKALESSRYQIDCYENIPELVSILGAESWAREQAVDPIWQDILRGRKAREAEAAERAVSALKLKKRRKITAIILAVIAVLGIILLGNNHG